MSDVLTDKTCGEFASVLAAKEPVPGGGGAAAYVGALAAALCSMVGNYTTGKKRYADIEGDIQRMLAEADAARVTLVGLVEADAAAFGPLSQAYAIPKEDPTRAGVLEHVTKTACAAPIAMVEECAHVIELLEEMGEKGSRMLLSDVGCGALFAYAAMKAAAMNVFVNTKTIADRAWADATESHVDELLDEWLPRAEATADAVMAKIRG